VSSVGWDALRFSQVGRTFYRRAEHPRLEDVNAQLKRLGIQAKRKPVHQPRRTILQPEPATIHRSRSLDEELLEKAAARRGKKRPLKRRSSPTHSRARVACARCGERILPGEPWDFGHSDVDRSRYTGPEHRHCNCSTSSRRVRWRSREW